MNRTSPTLTLRLAALLLTVVGAASPARAATIMWNRMRAPKPQVMQSRRERLKMFVWRRRATAHSSAAMRSGRKARVP